MSMRSYEDQIWHEEQRRRLSLIADGLTQLAEGVALCVADTAAAGFGVPPMSPDQLAQATGDYEAAGL